MADAKKKADAMKGRRGWRTRPGRRPAQARRRRHGRRRGGDVKKMEEALKVQVETFGMAEDEAAIYKLKLAGATEEMLTGRQGRCRSRAGRQKEAKEMADKRADAEKKIREDMERDAKSIYEETRTPAEKAQAERAKLDKLHAGGTGWTTTRSSARA